MTELFRFEYDDGEGLEVIQSVEGEILTYVEVTEKFLQFLKATGYDYLGAYRDEDGNIVIDHSGEVDLSRTVDLSFTDDELEDYAELADGWKSPEDYWDTVVDEVAEELSDDPLTVGDIVVAKSGGGPEKDAIGKVVQTDDGLYLVQFNGWVGGHDGEFGDGATTRWWFCRDELDLHKVEEGDVVEHTGKGTPDDFNGGHRGFRGDSLVGKFGVVTKVDGPVASVEWDDWEDGNGHYRDQWNVFIDNLKVVN